MGKRVLLRDRIDLIDRLSQTENFLSKRRLPFALKEGLLHKSCKVTDATFQGQVTKPLFFVVWSSALPNAHVFSYWFWILRLLWLRVGSGWAVLNQDLPPGHKLVLFSKMRLNSLSVLLPKGLKCVPGIKSSNSLVY